MISSHSSLTCLFPSFTALREPVKTRTTWSESLPLVCEIFLKSETFNICFQAQSLPLFFCDDHTSGLVGHLKVFWDQCFWGAKQQKPLEWEEQEHVYNHVAYALTVIRYPNHRTWEDNEVPEQIILSVVHMSNNRLLIDNKMDRSTSPPQKKNVRWK